MNKDKGAELDNDIDVDFDALFECAVFGVDIINNGNEAKAYYDPNSENHLFIVDNTKKKQNDNTLTKILVRNLPPEMTEAEFVNLISPLPEHNYFRYVHGNNIRSFSRVYINFLNPDDVPRFFKQMREFIFVDIKGNEYQAVVEFAPYQRITKIRPNRKMDPLCGTLLDDPDYLEFQKKFIAITERTQNSQATETIFNLSASSDSENESVTPLIEHLRECATKFNKYKHSRRPDRRRKDYDRKWIKEDVKRFKKERERRNNDYEFHGKNRNAIGWKDKRQANSYTSRNSHDQFRRQVDNKSKNNTIKSINTSEMDNGDVVAGQVIVDKSAKIKANSSSEDKKLNEREYNVMKEKLVVKGNTEASIEASIITEQEVENENVKLTSSSSSCSSISNNSRRNTNSGKNARKINRKSPTVISINTGSWKYINFIWKLQQNTGIILYSAKSRVRKICLQKVKRKRLFYDRFINSNNELFETSKNDRNETTVQESDDDSSNSKNVKNVSNSNDVIDDATNIEQKVMFDDIIEDNRIIDDNSIIEDKDISKDDDIIENNDIIKEDGIIEDNDIMKDNDIIENNDIIKDDDIKDIIKDDDIKDIIKDDDIKDIIKDDDIIRDNEIVLQESSSECPVNLINEHDHDVNVEFKDNVTLNEQHSNDVDELLSSTDHTNNNNDNDFGETIVNKEILSSEDLLNINDSEQDRISEVIIAEKRENDLANDVVNDVSSTENITNSNAIRTSRNERRIKNKDRPSLEIYRPGMGRYSKLRLQQERSELAE